MLNEGEPVYLLDDKGRRFWLRLRPDMVRVPNLGVVDARRLIGLEDGSKVRIAGRDFHVFRSLVADLMGSLERGPQIVTPKDAATLVFRLGLRAGDVVVEAGVGSGALTLALLNAVLPTGRVISVEVREEFASKARRNIENAGLDKYWQLVQGDIKSIDLGLRADAVMLDMPDPGDAIDNVTRILRPGGMLAVYVPNTNQVEAVVNKLRAAGYLEVVALENIQRTMDVHPGGIRPAYENLGHTGYLIFARRPAMA